MSLAANLSRLKCLKGKTDRLRPVCFDATSDIVERRIQRLFSMWLKRTQHINSRPSTSSTSHHRQDTSSRVGDCANCTTPQFGQHSTSRECGIVVVRFVRHERAVAFHSVNNKLFNGFALFECRGVSVLASFRSRKPKPRHNSREPNFSEQRVWTKRQHQSTT